MDEVSSLNHPPQDLKKKKKSKRNFVYHTMIMKIVFTLVKVLMKLLLKKKSLNEIW